MVDLNAHPHVQQDGYSVHLWVWWAGAWVGGWVSGRLGGQVGKD